MEIVEAPNARLESIQPIFKKRGTKKSNFRKRPSTPPAADSDSSAYSSSDDGEGRRVKRRRKAAGVVTSSEVKSKARQEDLETLKYSADRSAHIESSNDATKQSNWFDESITNETTTSHLLGTTRAHQGPSSDVSQGATYKGTSNYQTFIQKNPNAPSKQVGPVKAPTNIRTITVTDFAPDVCKDYKQTGFCGFGWFTPTLLWYHYLSSQY